MLSVVITGTSTGIGWGTTKVLIEHGFQVFGSVRKASDADRLSKQFGERFVPLLFDVTDESAVRAAAADVRVRLAGGRLNGLVNNAGVAVAGPLLELPIEQLRYQIDVNLIGVVIVCKAFAPLIGTDPDLCGNSGRIINVSSGSGRNAVPFLAPYAASKFALEGLSESLRRELMPFGIDVILIGPSTVATQIWKKAEQIDIAPYINTPYGVALQRLRSHVLSLGKHGLPPEKIGEAVLHALTGSKPRVRYAISPQPFQDWMARTLPKRMVDRKICRRLGLLPKRPLSGS